MYQLVALLLALLCLGAHGQNSTWPLSHQVASQYQFGRKVGGYAASGDSGRLNIFWTPRVADNSPSPTPRLPFGFSSPPPFI